jgi:hypothetical protein
MQPPPPAAAAAAVQAMRYFDSTSNAVTSQQGVPQITLTVHHLVTWQWVNITG